MDPQPKTTTTHPEPAQKNVLQMTAQLLWPVFRQAWLPLLVLHAIGIVFHDYSNQLTNFIRDQGREQIGILSLTMFFEVVFETLWSMLWLMVLIDSAAAVVEQRERASFFKLTGRYLNPLLIEYVRSLAAILFRIPLIFIPALLEYIRLLFVPLTVMLSPAYEDGQVDALQASRHLARGHWILLIVLSLINLSCSFALDDFGRTVDQPWFWQNPLPAGFAAVLTLTINLVYGIFLFSLFRRISMMRGLPLRPAVPAASMSFE